jgi:hypothetical protein
MEAVVVNDRKLIGPGEKRQTTIQSLEAPKGRQRVAWGASYTLSPLRG